MQSLQTQESTPDNSAKETHFEDKDREDDLRGSPCAPAARASKTPQTILPVPPPPFDRIPLGSLADAVYLSPHWLGKTRQKRTLPDFNESFQLY